MSYIGTLVKHCDHTKTIEQETQEEITLQSATITLQSAIMKKQLHPSSPLRHVDTYI